MLHLEQAFVSSRHMVDILVGCPSNKLEVVILVRMIVMIVLPLDKLDVGWVSISIEGIFCNGCNIKLGWSSQFVIGLTAMLNTLK